MSKPADVNIIQISTTQENGVLKVIGLGSDRVVYWWSTSKGRWEEYTDE